MWSSVEVEGAGGAGAGAAPCARGKHAAALLGEYVYVLGGRGAGGALPLRDFWRYSLASGRWERLEGCGSAPPALQEHTAVPHGAHLYVFGGEVGAPAGETPLWLFNTETQVWRKLSGAPQASARRTRGREGRRVRPGGANGGANGGAEPRSRRGHSAHALNDCMLIYGGYVDLRGSTNELWAFHYESESWQQVRTATAGPPRHRHAAALHRDRLYVHGGQCDLRESADLWQYDTMSRVWSTRGAGGARGGGGARPGARSGHAGLCVGAHLYIYGGESAGQPTNELWRFHFVTDTWERLQHGPQWPSPRVDCRALLAPPCRRPSGPAAPRAAHAAAPASHRHSLHSRPEPPQSIFREISKLSSFHIRRATRCSYSMLAASSEQDSTESLVHPAHPAHLAKSRSAYVIDKRAPGGGGGGGGGGGESPRAGDEAEMSREPISVPDFADMVLPRPVLSPVEAAKLVYLDSDEEEDMKRELRELDLVRRQEGRVVALPAAAEARYTRGGTAAPATTTTTATTTATTTEDEGESSTSDYASAERVNRLSSLGFCNPHYLQPGPDPRQLAALTPDSGLELQVLGESRRRPADVTPAPAPAPAPDRLLLVGGREPWHLALMQRPLSMWTYTLP